QAWPPAARGRPPHSARPRRAAARAAAEVPQRRRRGVRRRARAGRLRLHFPEQPASAPGPSDTLRAAERRAILDVCRLRDRLEHASSVLETQAAKWELARAERVLEDVEAKIHREFADLEMYPVPDYMQPTYRKGGVQMAVTGGSGVGKSDRWWINAIRRTSVRDPGAAATGITETTRHPQMFTFWPGRAGVFNKVFEQVGQILRMTGSEDSHTERRRASASAELIRTLVKNKDAWSYIDPHQDSLQVGDRLLLSGLGGSRTEECSAEIVEPPGRSHDRIRVRLGCGEVTDVSADRVLGVLAECAIWDLPGVGTPNFPQQTYLRNMGIRHFDLVVLMTASRFTESELMLVGELERWGVPYFLVRNKADFDVQSEIDELEQHFEDYEDYDGELDQEEKKKIEASTIESIREFFRTEHDLCNIYCVSSRPRHRTRFDFLRLEHDMEEALRRQRTVLSSDLR
ncbi:unnamed protein product, partial [Prorocentrum cordatum]